MDVEAHPPMMLMMLEEDYIGAVIVIILLLVLLGLIKLCKEKQRTSGGPIRYSPPSWEQRARQIREAALERARRREFPSTPRAGSDVSSCPVGGGCLVCGAPIREELSVRCPVCGRVRCPICQRFVARGQDLLACPHCKVPGHANEIRAWVSKKGTCPYCGRVLAVNQLEPPEYS